MTRARPRVKESPGISDPLERKETLSLLELRIAQLPAVPKKILAMYYCENMRVSEIAACFGLTESGIIRIRTKTVALLRNELLNSLGPERSPE